MRPQKHVSRAPPGRRNVPARALCITIPRDRGDESFADDLNMGRGIVSGRVALLLRSTEIRPHRPNDLLPPQGPHAPGCPPQPFSPPGGSNTWKKKEKKNLFPLADSWISCHPGLEGLAARGGRRREVVAARGTRGAGATQGNSDIGILPDRGGPPPPPAAGGFARDFGGRAPGVPISVLKKF